MARPSPWRDEAVTVAVASRDVADILALVRAVDLVHAPFYLLVHALFGANVTVPDARWVSVVAAALTGPVLYGTARRAADRAVGAAAVGCWLALPLVTRFAQEARPYALAALLAACSTYALLRATTAAPAPTAPGRPVPPTAPGRPPGGRRWWVLYALSLPAVVALNTVAGLVVLGHAAWVLTGPRGQWRRALVAAAAGAVPAVPLVLAAQRQSGQVAFLRPPGARDLTGHLVVTAGSPLAAVLVVVAAVVVLALGRHRRLALLGATWGLLPLPLLWGLSQVRPFWTTRYLVPALPGLCLLLAGAAALAVGGHVLARRLPAAALVVALVVAGLPAQQRLRGPLGHVEDMRGAARLLAERSRPGDAVLFVPNGEYRYRVLAQVYPGALRNVRDVALAAGPVESATLVGVEHGPAGVEAALRGTRRVWVVGRPGEMITAEPGDVRKLELLARRYRQVEQVELRDWTVRLFVAR
ncbi:hypothetical protein [Kineococcus sp. NUM-3379]